MRNFLTIVRLSRCLLCVVFLLSFAASGFAFYLPGGADPGLVSEDLSRSPQLTKKGVVPVVPQLALIKSGAHGRGRRFVLNRIELTGPKRYSGLSFTHYYYRYLGQRISYTDLQTIATRIAARYRQQGYLLTRVIIPKQFVRHGVVTLRVQEGYVRDYSIQGDAGKALHLLNAYAKKIVASRPLRNKVLQRYALLANDIPGLNVAVRLVPEKKQPYIVRMVFVVKRKAYDAYALTNNYSSSYYHRQQFMLGGNLYNLTGADRNGISALTTDFSRLNFVQIDRDRALGSSGGRMWLSAAYTRTKPGSDLAQYNIVGTDFTGQLELSYPLIRSYKYTWFLTSGFQYANVENNYNVPSELLYRDHTRVINLGTTYEFLDPFHGANLIGVKVYRGLNFWDASTAGSDNLSRVFGDPQFTKVNMEIAHIQYLPYNFSVFVDALGQYAFNPLLASQQFNFGGGYLGRGFAPAEIVGDKGASAKAELRYTESLSSKSLFSGIQYFGFYDVGAIHNISHVFQPQKESGSTAGFGIRFTVSRYVFGSVVYAKPITTHNFVDPVVKSAVILFDLEFRV